MLKLLVGLVMVVYPFLVYAALDSMQPRYLALLLAGLFALRWLQQGGTARLLGAHWLAPLALLLLLAVVLSNQGGLLLAYPVLVSALFFTVFCHSLLHPPSVAERIARLSEPDLPPRGVRYTRRVTQVWCGFFLANGMAATATAFSGDRWLWSLYNGFISYVLMAVLMGSEWLVRRRVRRSL
jgi:uncharacterized membrane protein